MNAPAAQSSQAVAARWAIAAAAVAAALVFAYLPALHGALLWDDDGHVTPVGLRSLSGLWRIWTEPGASQQYYPVLHSAFWIEHRLWGDHVEGYHALNVALHLASAALLWRLLVKIELPGAALGACLFALHPVCAESVAWISEQKNVLSGVFYLGAALAYLRFEGVRSVRSYLLATGLFACALLSKSVTATLPAALLVLAWWRRGRIAVKGDVLCLVPWFALSVAAGSMTAWMETHVVGASGGSFALSAGERLIVSGRALAFYLGKCIWPAGLAFNYPRWQLRPEEALSYGWPLAVLLVLGGLIALRGRSRGPLCAALLYAGALFPALGFFNVYPFVFSFVADHFQYLAVMVFSAAAGAALHGAASRARIGATGSTVGAAALLVCLMLATRAQARRYEDPETFYRAMLASNPDSWLAHDNLGVVLTSKGAVAEASEHYRKAMALNPDYPEAFNNYGNLMARSGRFAEAAEAYGKALRARPWFEDAQVNWGNALCDQGDFAAAVAHFRDALALKKDDARALYGLGNALANTGRYDEAVLSYRAARALAPDFALGRLNLGLALVRSDHVAEGMAEVEAAAALDPDKAGDYRSMAHAYRGVALAERGDLAGAEPELRQAVLLRPGDAEIRFQLARVLHLLGREAEAREQYDLYRAARRAGSQAP